MDGFEKQDLGGESLGFLGSTTPAESFVPPPPPEVKIRTFQSDLESMARGGGPQFQKVKAPGLLGLEDESRGERTEREEHGEKLNRTILLVVLVFALVGIVAVGVYLLYGFLSGGKSPQPGNAVSGGGLPVGNSSAADTEISLRIAGFSHESVFERSSSSIVMLYVPEVASDASLLQTFGQRLSGVLESVTSTTNLFEV